MPKYSGVFLKMTIVSFKPSKGNLEFMSNLENKNKFLNELIQLVRTGETNIKIKQDGLETEIALEETTQEKVKLEKEITLINRYNQLIKESQAKTELLQIQADYIENFKMQLPDNSRRILKQEINNNMQREDYIHNQTIHCPKCPEIFKFSSDFTLRHQKEAFYDHYTKAHNNLLPKDLMDQMERLQWE